MNKQIDIQELLDWYIWAGVTETSSDEVCLLEKNEHFTLNQSSSTVNSSQTTKSPLISIKPSSSISKDARDICSQAKDLQELKQLIANFNGCNLKNTAASTVFGKGNPQAKIMLIGEAPGADEDRMGEPFVGRCGKLLDKMFKAMDIKREDCYITNVLPWRPPGNRTPTDDEIAICLPFLKRQIELIEPDFILFLGGIALKSVMDTTDSISRTRGKWLEYQLPSTKVIQVLATYHPSYLLRTPAQKSKVWTDLLRLKQKFAEK